MSTVSLTLASKHLEELTDEQRRALRGSKFASSHLEPVDATKSFQPRLAHPGGALATNKAAALAKFLKRKLDGPAGASSLDPALVELAVDNAKASLIGISAKSKVQVRHVVSFSNSEEDHEDKMHSKKDENDQSYTSLAEGGRNVMKSKMKRRRPKKKKKG